MAYIINHTNGTKYLELGEGVLDQSLGISLIGQNFHNYGQLIATNFLQLIENQANTVPPSNPVEGQLWWNSALKQLNYFNGNQWKTNSNTAIHVDPPFKPVDGDQWWDTGTHQLKIFNGTDWVIIGPLNPEGQHFSGIMPITASDNAGQQHTIATISVDGVIIGLLNKDESFTLATPIAGISLVGKGTTYAPGTLATGNAQNALQLGGVNADQYVRISDTSSVMQGSLAVSGTVSMGNAIDPLRIYTTVNNSYQIASSSTDVAVGVGSTLLQVSGVNQTVTVTAPPTLNTSVTTKQYVDTLVASTDHNTREYVDTQISAVKGPSPVLGTLAKLSHAVGDDPNYATNMNAALSFKAPVFSPDFTGTPQSITVPYTDNSRKIATTAYVHSVISNGVTSVGTLTGLTVAGDILPETTEVYNVGSPTKKFLNFYGISMHANYADLAENYHSDNAYAAGTVVVFGGKYDITVSGQYADHRVAGVISTKPAYLMNNTGEAEYQPVALTGKVPCFVVGPIKKGDILVNSTVAGIATKLSSYGDWVPGCVIGKSLEDSDEIDTRTVMIAVGRF